MNPNYNVTSHLPSINSPYYLSDALTLHHVRLHSSQFSLSLTSKPTGGYVTATFTWPQCECPVQTVLFVQYSDALLETNQILVHKNLIQSIQQSVSHPLPQLTCNLDKLEITQNEAQELHLECYLPDSNLHSISSSLNSVFVSLFTRQFIEFPVLSSTFLALRYFSNGFYPLKIRKLTQSNEGSESNGDVYARITQNTVIHLTFKPLSTLDFIGDENSKSKIEFLVNHLQRSYPTEFTAIQQFIHQNLFAPPLLLSSSFFTQFCSISPFLVLTGDCGKSYLIESLEKIYTGNNIIEEGKDSIRVIKMDGYELLNHTNPSSIFNSLTSQPSLFLFDDFDCVFTKQNQNSALILNTLDSIINSSSSLRHAIIITLHSLSSIQLHPSFSRSGKFLDTIIIIKSLQIDQRKAILEYYIKEMNKNKKDNNNNNIEMKEWSKKLSEITAGFNGRDIVKSIQSAGLDNTKERSLYEKIEKGIAESRPSQATNIESSQSSIQMNITSTSSSLNPPCINWAPLGGYKKLKTRLELLLFQWKNPCTILELGLKPISGILFYGESGVGKTVFARKMIENSLFNSVSIVAADIYSKYLGETEKKIREVFARATKLSPCIIFIDELDSIATNRGNNNNNNNSNSSGNTENRLLATLLNELDGIESRVDKQVYIIACTNRIKSIDPALLRPGRFDETILIKLPDLVSRREIIQAIIDKDNNINTNNNNNTYYNENEMKASKQGKIILEMEYSEFVSKLSSGFTAADLESLLRDIKMYEIRKLIGENIRGENLNELKLSLEGIIQCLLEFGVELYAINIAKGELGENNNT